MSPKGRANQDGAKNMGGKTKERRTHNISIRVTEALFEKALMAAESEGRSMANWIETLIVKAVGDSSIPRRRGVRNSSKADRDRRITEGLQEIRDNPALLQTAGE